MKYIALIYTAASANPTYGTPEFDAQLAAYKVATDTYLKDGVMRGGDALHPTSMATTVRVRKGKVETLDGPFAETKEQLGGYYILECANLDEAIKYAALIPGAAIGSIELRPLVNIDYNTM
jgi:hypothetical protein